MHILFFKKMLIILILVQVVVGYCCVTKLSDIKLNALSTNIAQLQLTTVSLNSTVPTAKFCECIEQCGKTISVQY